MEQTLGHYRVVEAIGSGGMGEVYRARDERLHRDVAVKVLSSAKPIDAHARARFRREAHALSQLNHPNIATIHDFDTFDGVDVLVMEYIPGTSLDDEIRRGPLPEAEVVRLGRQLVEGLAAAHEHGIIHRDLKPGNVRITPDRRVKILDFGIARVVQVDGDATTNSATSTVFAGTLPYMAPEQIKGGIADVRGDLYGAGAILYEMATGIRLHGGLSGARLLGAILDEPPAPARERNPGVSGALEQVLSKALDRNPDLRYQSARELAVDLERLIEGDASTRSSTRTHARRLPWRAAAVVVLAAAAVIAWLAYRQSNHPPPAATSVVIADFANDTGDAALSEFVRAGLSVQLQQSHYTTVVSRERVFDALRRMQRPLSSLDVDTARELCVRESIPVLLAGTIQRRGAVTRIEVQAITPSTGATIFSGHEEFQKDGDAFRSIDRLAQLLRRELGESAAGIEQRTQPLASVTTGSLQALEQYSLGATEFARGNSDAALRSLRAALDVDPQFAMAHRLIARVYETLGNADQERQHLAAAYTLRASLTERERRHVEAGYLHGQGEYARAAETLSALTALYPGDGEAHYELAVAYRDAGNMRAAVQELETTIARTPYVAVAYGELMLLLARTSNYARAAQVYGEAQRRGITGPRVTWGHGMLLLGEGQPAEARAAFTRLESDGEVFAGVARLYQAVIDTYEGKMDAAREKLQRDVLLDRKAHNTSAELKRRELLARVALVNGDVAGARQQVALMLGANADAVVRPEDLRQAVTLSARAGDLHRARALAAQLAKVRQTIGDAFAQGCYADAMAEVALAERQPRLAIALFNEAEAQYWLPAVTQGLARAYAASGDSRRAAEQWKRFIDARGESMHEGLAAEWVLAHAEAAAVERQSGNLAAAEQYQNAFTSLWRDADRRAR